LILNDHLSEKPETVEELEVVDELMNRQKHIDSGKPNYIEDQSPTDQVSNRDANPNPNLDL